MHILLRASIAHLCGSLHFILNLSWIQSQHRHHVFDTCGQGCCGALSCADILSKSAIVYAL